MKVLADLGMDHLLDMAGMEVLMDTRNKCKCLLVFRLFWEWKWYN